MLFIPSSLLAELRRMVVAQLEEAPAEQTSSQDNQQMVADDAMMPNGWQREYIQHTYLYNIANREARAFYQQHHRHELAPAYELSPTSREHRAERNGKLALAQKIHGDKFGNHGNQSCQSPIEAIQQALLIFKVDILKGFWQMLDHP